jgi:hypothetical protein
MFKNAGLGRKPFYPSKKSINFEKFEDVSILEKKKILSCFQSLFFI